MLKKKFVLNNISIILSKFNKLTRKNAWNVYEINLHLWLNW
jgi:hypothetical protein